MGKYYDVERMVQGAAEARRRGLVITASLIIGFPGEDQLSLANTRAALQEADFNYLFLHALNVVPHTPLWRLKDRFGLKLNKTGYWAHPTMTLGDVPAVAREMIRSTHLASSTVFVNVKRNLAAPFLAADHGGRLDGLSQLVQDILANEWAPGPDPRLRLGLWERLQETADQLPAYALKRLPDAKASA
jgi:hypothetical protein